MLQTDDVGSARARRISAVSTLGVMLAVLLVSSGAHAAAGLRFLRESPLSRFTEQDFDLLRKAAGVVLSAEANGASEEWANPATGNSGRITSVSRFTATDERPCARLKIDARSTEFDGSWTYTVCRGADGDWLIDGTAKPK